MPGLTASSRAPRHGLGARSAWLAVALAALAALAVAWFLAGSGHRAAGRVAPAHGFASVPLAARGPISSALGRDELGYRVAGMGRTTRPSTWA